jgi:hypothetical protein
MGTRGDMVTCSTSTLYRLCRHHRKMLTRNVAYSLKNTVTGGRTLGVVSGRWRIGKTVEDLQCDEVQNDIPSRRNGGGHFEGS